MSTAVGMTLPAEQVLAGTIEEQPFELWVLRVAEARVELRDLALLDADEQRRARLIAGPKERLSFLAGRLLLRRLLASAARCREEEIVYAREPCPVCGGPDGRPVLAAPAGTVNFSLSRSRGLVAVGVAPVPIGVDVETLPTEEVSDEVSLLLHPRERAEIELARAQRRPEVFARVWTRKEAYFKGLGCGVGHELSGVYLGTLHPSELPAGWALLDLPVGPSHVASVALRCPGVGVRVTSAGSSRRPGGELS